jgi:hypothetical protein
MGRRRSLESSRGEWDSWGAFIDCWAMNNCRRVESERNNNEENGQDRVMLLMEGVESHGDWGETSPI